MHRLKDLTQLTADLTLAAEQSDLGPAHEVLAARRSLLRQGRLPPPGELRSILERGRRVVENLQQRRAGLAADIERLKQARGRLGAFHPARNQRRRLDLEM